MEHNSDSEPAPYYCNYSPMMILSSASVSISGDVIHHATRCSRCQHLHDPALSCAQVQVWREIAAGSPVTAQHKSQKSQKASNDGLDGGSKS